VIYDRMDLGWTGFSAAVLVVSLIVLLILSATQGHREEPLPGWRGWYWFTGSLLGALVSGALLIISAVLFGMDTNKFHDEMEADGYNVIKTVEGVMKVEHEGKLIDCVQDDLDEDGKVKVVCR
jgi:hypothetical protein